MERVDRRLWAVACTATLGLAALLALFPCKSDDLYMHLAIGRRFFRDGAFPAGDPFLFAQTEVPPDWIVHGGSHLGAYLLYLAGGFDGLVLAKTLLVVVGAAAPLWLARHAGNRSAAVPALTLLALWAGCDRFIERSSLVSDVAGAWTLALLGADLVRPTRARWAIPAIFAVWTNAHSGIVTGLSLVAAAAAARPGDWRRSLPLLGACVATTFLHPTGPMNLWWAIAGSTGAHGALMRKHYFEWMPTLSSAYRGTREVWLFLALSVAVAALVVRSFRAGSRPWFAAVSLGGLTALGLSAIRFVTTAAFALPVLAALDGRRTPAGATGASDTPGPSRRHRLSLAAVTAVALACIVRIAVSGYSTPTGPRRVGLGVDPASVPERAAAFARTLPEGTRIFNEHEFGSYLAWAWDGDPPVFFHGYVLDPTFYERDYLGVNRSPQEFRRIVDAYGIGAFLLKRIPVTPASGPLFHRLLLTLPEWRLVHWDDSAIVFLRDLPSLRPVIDAREYRYVDPFRVDRLERGLREDPARVREEAIRAFRDSPDNALLRRLLSELFGEDPDRL